MELREHYAAYESNRPVDLQLPRQANAGSVTEPPHPVLNILPRLVGDTPALPSNVLYSFLQLTLKVALCAVYVSREILA